MPLLLITSDIAFIFIFFSFTIKILIYRNERDYWGKSPGKYKIQRTEKYELYGYKTNDPTQLLNVETVGKSTYNVENSYDNITYNPSVRFNFNTFILI